MFGRNQISDKDLLKTINQRLARTGTASQSRVNVSVQQGNVTLTGSLQYAIQRIPIVKTISRIAGVRRVIDQMRLIVKQTIHHDAARNVHLPEQPLLLESSSVPATEEVSADEPTRPE